MGGGGCMNLAARHGEGRHPWVNTCGHPMCFDHAAHLRYSRVPDAPGQPFATQFFFFLPFFLSESALKERPRKLAPGQRRRLLANRWWLTTKLPLSPPAPHCPVPPRPPAPSFGAPVPSLPPFSFSGGYQ